MLKTKTVAKKATKKLTIDQLCYPIGKTMFIRTVTHHLVGVVKAVGKTELLLKGGTVMWVADDGRFTQAVETGSFSETEAYAKNDVVVGRGSIIDATVLVTSCEVKQK